MRPTETLRKEHNLALQVTRAAEREVRLIHDTSEFREEIIDMIVDFFHFFTSACHEPKEEKLLFARMAARGLSTDTGLLGEIEREHNEFRARIKEITEWRRRRRAGAAADVEELAGMLNGYLKLMRAHVTKENDLLFPLANQLLTDRDQVELETAFSSIECEEILVGVHDKYSDLAHRLASRSTEILEKEHKVVLLVTAAAEREVQAMRENGQVRAPVLDKLIDFYEYFADACHDPKEERLLFARLSERGMSADSGILAEVWQEHREFRSRLEAIRTALERARSGNGQAVTALADELSAYLELMRSHTVRENEILFPMVGHLLTDADQEELTREYESVEAEEILKGVHDKYFELAHALTLS